MKSNPCPDCQNPTHRARGARCAMHPFARGLRALIRGYQLVLSPLVGPRCRFQPTCSAYAIEALEVHGAAPGLWLALRRFVRCHPWGGHGWDPVPPAAGAAPGQHSQEDQTQSGAPP